MSSFFSFSMTDFLFSASTSACFSVSGSLLHIFWKCTTTSLSSFMDQLARSSPPGLEYTKNYWNCSGS